MNFKKLPKQEDVTEFDLGDTKAKLVAVTDENRAHLTEIALSMYADEPCRICGQTLTMNDIKAGAVYAGYSKPINGRVARSAHKACWVNRPAQSQWAYPDND